MVGVVDLVGKPETLCPTLHSDACHIGPQATLHLLARSRLSMAAPEGRGEPVKRRPV
jgi:hypothetical protein